MVTQAREHIRRTVPLRVKLSPSVAERLDAIARPRGMTAATMGAFAVGEFVERIERVIRAEGCGISNAGQESGGAYGQG